MPIAITGASRGSARSEVLTSKHWNLGINTLDLKTLEIAKAELENKYLWHEFGDLQLVLP